MDESKVITMCSRGVERNKNRMNTIIAEFIGLVVISEVTRWTPKALYVSELVYHKSIDAMIPVINKINSLGFRFIIGKGQTQVFDDGKKSPYHFIIDADFYEDIVINTWHACYSFAKWYNKERNINTNYDYQI